MILSFDTSGAYVGAALLDAKGNLLGETQEDMAKGQAERLMPLIAELMSQAGVNRQDLSQIAVGTGPGNFTGIRISVSAARGLALALGIPATGVTLLQALAFGTTGPRIACLPAPRGLVYVQGFDGADPAKPVLTDPAALPATTAKLIGPPSEALARITGGTPTPAARTPAAAIAHLGLLSPAKPGIRPSPLYLRPADAAPARQAPPVITG